MSMANGGRIVCDRGRMMGTRFVMDLTIWEGNSSISVKGPIAEGLAAIGYIDVGDDEFGSLTTSKSFSQITASVRPP